jgi:hypothetical protein
MRFLIVILVCLNSMVLLAQEGDSTTTDTSEVSQPVVTDQPDPLLKEGNPLSQDANIKIQREEVPLFLQKILQDEKYRGWESGGVFRNEQSTMFKVEARDGMNNRTFYFDQQGKLLRAE